MLGSLTALCHGILLLQCSQGACELRRYCVAILRHHQSEQRLGFEVTERWCSTHWPLTSPVTLGRSGPQFPHLQSRDANAYLLGLWGESNAVMCVIHGTQLMSAVSWFFSLVIASAVFIVLPQGLLSNSCKSLKQVTSWQPVSLF